MMEPQELEKIAELLAEKMRPAASKRARVRKQDVIPEYLTEEEIPRFLAVIAGVSARDHCMFSVCYYHGLRASELGIIDLKDYQPATGKLLVRRLKGSRGGEYLLLPAERNAMKVWLKRRGKEPGPLFPSRKHRGIERTQVFRLMRRYCEAAGISPEKRHPHALKHSCAMHLAAQQPDIVAVQDWLGHADIRNTMKYVRMTSARRQDFAKQLEDGGWGRK